MDNRIGALFDELLDEARDAVPGKIDNFAAAYHQFQDSLEEVLFGVRVQPRSKAQPIQFMTHLLPVIHAHMRRFPQGTRFSILDVGPGMGTGSNLLGLLYARNGLGYTASVNTIDFRPRSLKYMKVFCRHTRPSVGTIFDVKGAYDIVMASHVIEHVSEPREFAAQMRRLSRGIVIICAPYKEPCEAMSKAHVNTFDDRFFSEIGADKVEIVQSPAWGQFREPPYRMFIAVLPGKATPLRLPDPSRI